MTFFIHLLKLFYRFSFNRIFGLCVSLHYLRSLSLPSAWQRVLSYLVKGLPEPNNFSWRRVRSTRSG